MSMCKMKKLVIELDWENRSFTMTGPIEEFKNLQKIEWYEVIGPDYDWMPSIIDDLIRVSESIVTKEGKLIKWEIIY